MRLERAYKTMATTTADETSTSNVGQTDETSPSVPAKNLTFFFRKNKDNESRETEERRQTYHGATSTTPSSADDGEEA